MSTKPFYNHIAGLRGIAIILVILFHLCSNYFPHGFYGVDVFLVISGYLLFLSASRDNFQLSIKDFASKKIFRIFPPMVILVLITIVAAIFLLDGDSLISTSRTGRYTMFCYANDFLRRTQSDYFAANALENPLLHMWYLSVTIHLYLMFAIGCVVYKYIPKKLSVVLLWLIGIASFVYGYSYQLSHILQNIGLPSWNQYVAVSHYLTLPRIWELLAGGAILLLPATNKKPLASVLTAVGLAAVLLPALSSDFIASYGAPAVVVGTMLIIRYMPASILTPVLSNKVMLWIGGISFSLYLVHMPIIAFYTIMFQKVSTWGDYTIIVSLSLLLGWLFWYLVEKRKFKAYTALALWVVCLVLCVLGKKLDDIKNKMHPEVQAINHTAYDDWQVCEENVLADGRDPAYLKYTDAMFNMARSTRKKPQTSTPLMQMGPASTSPCIVLLGDSHAHSAYFGLNRLCREMNVPGAFLTTTVIPMWDYEFHRSDEYADIYYIDEAKVNSLLNWLKANPCVTHVVIAQFWRSRLDRVEYTHWDKTTERMTTELMHKSVREFVKRIHDMGRHVVLLGPAPEPACDNPLRYVRLATRKGQNPIDLAPLTCTRQDMEERNKDIIAMLKSIQAEGLCSILDTISIMEEDKPFIVYKDGTFMMYDDDHLSGEGSTALFRQLKPQFETILNQRMPEK